MHSIRLTKKDNEIAKKMRNNINPTIIMLPWCASSLASQAQATPNTTKNKIPILPSMVPITSIQQNLVLT